MTAPGSGPASAATSSSTPAASAKALCACGPPNGTSSSRSGGAGQDVPVRDGAHRDVGDDGRPSEDGIAIAIGFVPVRAGPPSGCGRRRGDVAVTTATRPASARRRAHAPRTPVGKHASATTTRAPPEGPRRCRRRSPRASIPSARRRASARSRPRARPAAAARRDRPSRRAFLRATGPSLARAPCVLPDPQRPGGRRPSSHPAPRAPPRAVGRSRETTSRHERNPRE